MDIVKDSSELPVMGMSYQTHVTPRLLILPSSTAFTSLP